MNRWLEGHSFVIDLSRDRPKVYGDIASMAPISQKNPGGASTGPARVT